MNAGQLTTKGSHGVSAAILSAMTAACGCQYDVPKVSILDQRDVDAVRKQITYDMTGDGKEDYTQILVEGMVREFRFKPGGEATPEGVVRSADLDPRTTNHLLLFLDGVPFDLMVEMWEAGYFRLFHRPGRLIGPFPAMTDVSFSQIFQIEPPPGYEAGYFDRDRDCLSNATQVYLSGKNECWARGVHYRMPFLDDAIMYLFPRHVFRQELKNGRTVFDRTKDPHVVLYLLSTDGLCHMRPRQEVKEYLRMLDTWVQRIVYEQGAKLHMTMLADHGNDFAPCRRLPIEKALRDAGLRMSKSLDRPGEVVVPLFGLINYAAVYTGNPKDQEAVVRAVRGLEGVDLVCYREGCDGPVVVQSATGRAVLRTKTEPAAGESRMLYRYDANDGDPLALNEAVSVLGARGKLDSEGYASEAEWLEATAAHRYPDPLRRIEECLSNASRNPADVLVSLKEGWYVGDPSLAAWVSMAGTHGALQSSSATSFIMSTAHPSPPYLTPQQVLPWIRSFTPWNPKISKVK